MNRRVALSATRVRWVLIAALLLAGCGPADPAPRLGLAAPPPLAAAIDDLPVSVVTFTVPGELDRDGTAQLVVRVAQRPDDLAQGLMGVTDLPEGVGMLFVFDVPAPRAGRGGFWMLDTLVPLDIAFVAQGRVVGTATMQPCTARPCPVTHPGVDYDAAVETVAGWLGANGIEVGAGVSWTPPAPGEG